MHDEDDAIVAGKPKNIFLEEVLDFRHLLLFISGGFPN